MNELPDFRQACGYLEEELYLQLTQPKKVTKVDINEAFPSKYLKATDLKGRSIKVTIAGVERGDAEVDGKPIMHFVGKEKGMVLNVTNARALAAELGPETEGWNGVEVELFSAKVPFKNQVVDALRVRPIIQPPGQPDDLDVPF